MAAVGANEVAEQRPPPGYHEVEDHPNMYVGTPAMQQRIPEDRQGYPLSVKRFVAGNDLLRVQLRVQSASDGQWGRASDSRGGE